MSPVTDKRSEIIIEEFHSEALEGNALGDPTTRRVPVYLPAGYDPENEKYPSLYFLASFGSRGLKMLSDDLWEENHLFNLNRLVNKYPYEKVFSSSFRYSNESWSIVADIDDYIIENYFIEALSRLRFRNKELICSSCCLIKKECFSNVGFYKEILFRGEDLDMWARLGREYRIVKSEKITAVYRLEAENRSMNKNILFANSFESTINLNKIDDKDEFNCLKSQIRLRVKSYIYKMEWRSLLRVLIKFNYRLI